MLEFDLHQGWSRGLRIGFENIETSALMNPKLALSVEQTHSDILHAVAPSDLLKPAPIARADGLFVQGDFFKASKRPLVIKTADCTPLFLVDRESQALAAIHAGWRGLAQGIHLKLFRQGALDPKTTWAWVGPCLSGEGFEVREDMWKHFDLSVVRDPAIFQPTLDPAVRVFDAWKFIDRDLRALGVEMVYNVEVNTYRETEFHSYRRATRAGEKLAGHNYSWCKFF